MPARALTRWLLRLVAVRRHKFRAVHQISHLPCDTAAQRSSDHRVLLGRADRAAEDARRSGDFVFNVSGLHPGVDGVAVYEADTGWRVDSVLAPVVADRLRQQRLRK